MRVSSPYLDELYENLDSPVAILELWDFAMQELQKEPNNAELNWILAFDQLYKWERSSEAASVKIYYNAVEEKMALVTYKFLEILGFTDVLEVYVKGLGEKNEDSFKEIDIWIEENNDILDEIFVQILLAKKEWFYSRN